MIRDRWNAAQIARFDRQLKAATAEGLSQRDVVRIYAVSPRFVAERVRELRARGELPERGRWWGDERRGPWCRQRRRSKDMSGINERPQCLFAGDVLLPPRQGAARWPFGALEPWSYDLIMADPPWWFAMRSPKGESKSPQAQYACMSVAEIAALPVGELSAADSVLWLWATAPMMPDALLVMKAWGFRYVTMGAWHKTTAHGQTAFGTGYRLRSACEPFLIGTRGRPVTTKSVRNLIVGEAREHSRKPEEAFTAAERLMRHGGCHAEHGPARRIEVFSRETRPGWDNWGLERTKFNKETTQ